MTGYEAHLELCKLLGLRPCTSSEFELQLTLDKTIIEALLKDEGDDVYPKAELTKQELEDILSKLRGKL